MFETFSAHGKIYCFVGAASSSWCRTQNKWNKWPLQPYCHHSMYQRQQHSWCVCVCVCAFTPLAKKVSRNGPFFAFPLVLSQPPYFYYTLCCLEQTCRSTVQIKAAWADLQGFNPFHKSLSITNSEAAMSLNTSVTFMSQTQETDE